MPVKVVCPNSGCGASYNVTEDKVGRKARCPRCRQEFVITGGRGEVFGEIWPASIAPSSVPPVVPDPPPFSPNGSQPGVIAPGTVFGRYRVEVMLGRGGMGAVYRASDMVLGRKVALKIPNFHADERPDIIRRFAREAKAAAAFDHPSLCPVFDIGEVSGVHYLTMPYLEGRPLSTVLRERRIDPVEAAGIVRELALALAEAHDRGVVHRDLKPSNIMMNPKRGPVVMDFGLARLSEADDSRLTQSGAFLGTVSYMSPEQVDGELDAIGPASDQYSLGVILYELLSGRLPFEGKPTTVLLKIKTEPPPLAELGGHVDATLARVCGKAMAKLPRDRFAGCRDLAEALGEWLKRNQPGRSTAPGTGTGVRSGAVKAPWVDRSTEASARPGPARPPRRPVGVGVPPTEQEVVLVPVEPSGASAGNPGRPPCGPWRRLVTILALPVYLAAVAGHWVYVFWNDTSISPGVGLALFGLTWLAVTCVPLWSALGGRPHASLRFLSYMFYWPLAWCLAILAGAEAAETVRHFFGPGSAPSDLTAQIAGFSILLAPLVLVGFHVLVRNADVRTKCLRMNALVLWIMILALVLMITNCFLIPGHASGPSRVARETANMATVFSLILLGPVVLGRLAEVFRGEPAGGGSARVRLGRLGLWLPAAELVLLPLLGVGWLVLWWAGRGPT